MSETYDHKSASKRLSYAALLIASLAVLAVLVIASAGMGYMDIPFGHVAGAMWEAVTGQSLLGDSADQIRAVVVDVRLPRIMAALLVGAGLSVSGAVFQGILLNPLADPYTLGVSAGAAFGAAVALLFNMGQAAQVSIPLFAFTGASLTLFVVIFLSASGQSGRTGLSSSNLILSGIIISAILSAGISFMKYLADEQVSVIIFWLMGSFAAATWSDVGLLLVSLAVSSAVFMFFARDLNLMSLGEKSAVTLGVNTRNVTLILLITASFLAALCVSVSGIIGFVGLLIPHMIRFVTGPDNRKLMPLCFLVGAILLLSADTLTRAVLPSEIPIGVLTALIGGPVFCVIFKKSHMTEKRG